MDIHEQAASAVDMADAREGISQTAKLAGLMRDAFLEHGFTREEAVALTAEWLSDVRGVMGG